MYDSGREGYPSNFWCMIQVEKEIPLTLDVGSLAAFDISAIDLAKMGAGKERSKFLKVSG